jgi:glutamate synthase (ferredoxin)
LAPMYDARYEHDSCGVGFVADIKGRRSHRTVQQGLEAVASLTHRGAIAADARSGDGAGLLTQLPHEFLATAYAEAGQPDLDTSRMAVGVLFLNRQDPRTARRVQRLAESICQERGFSVAGWRDVPTDETVLGEAARSTMPDIKHLLLVANAEVDNVLAAERQLFLARNELEGRMRSESLEGSYVVSLSARTIIYKGLVVGTELGHFFTDLSDPSYHSAMAVFHQRYSTNTHPTWELAQPFRMLAHNGEINTLDGNRNWLRAREGELQSSVFGDDVALLKPVTDDKGSDSYSLDHVLELLTLAGRDLVHSAMMLIPEAWRTVPGMPAPLRDFYNYHACLMEPWDGPSALAFSDGRWVCGSLDRNGLRPARYVVTDDGTVVMASEVGVIDLDDAHIVEKGRLGPGRIIAIDLETGRLLKDYAAKRETVENKPYADWLRDELVELDSSIPVPESGNTVSDTDLVQLQHVHGFTQEDLTHIVQPMALQGLDPVFSMGNDAPLAVMSEFRPPVFAYLKQRFAQVTNPPIDPLREQLVMSLATRLGSRGNFLEPSADAARLLQLTSPVLSDDDFARVVTHTDPAFPSTWLDAVFPVEDGASGLARALDELETRALGAIDSGSRILVLSDRKVGAAHAPIPIALAVGALHHRMIDASRRMRASIVVHTAQSWDVHHICALIGYGASAVNPYMAIATVRGFCTETATEIDPVNNFLQVTEAGIRKVMSKMGISTISSYHGAQIFEAVGLAPEVIDRCFSGTASRIGGIGFEELGKDVLSRHAAAFAESSPDSPIDIGWVRYRRDGEFHATNPGVVKAMHRAIRTGSKDDFATYDAAVNDRPPHAIRDLLRFTSSDTEVPIEDVEPIETIVRRFTTTAMSIGALSPEAHSTISRGMNRLHARSNTGEGGEDRTWYKADENGDARASRIKQVASGRFGVTPLYLSKAEQLEIKMAQGSKPGEGGQLPASKVSAYIAGIRHTIPGIPLISPPPHHDIYSIEDLAQLIYDLKHANSSADVGVKLVAESGVGTIAAGVAKAYADYVLISGHDGGTGASPLSSIKNAGVPWEIGLAETQHVLVRNGLRDRILVKTDGGLKTARDVVIAGMLGAEEFGFGTVAAVAVGCIMARQCHLNTCPVGVATQREDLRQRFAGEPEHVVRFFTHLAQEVREIMASLGVRRFDDLVGQVRYLEPDPERLVGRTNNLDLNALLASPDTTGVAPLRRLRARNDRPVDDYMDDRICEIVNVATAAEKPIQLDLVIANTDRAVGAGISGRIVQQGHEDGLPDGSIQLTFRGTAGQSFGAFTVRGVTLHLIGEANDFVGKGLGGGTIVVHPAATAAFAAEENVIIGNTVLYGATSGRLFVAGRAGERFAVRNSGAEAVVEGVGDHGCEYMTGGTVVVLGPTGRNFAAGMSAGVAYIYDPKKIFLTQYNPELVSVGRVASKASADHLKSLIKAHVAATSSRLGQKLIDAWATSVDVFWQVTPYPPVVDTSEPTTVDKDRTRRAVESRRHAAMRPEKSRRV